VFATAGGGLALLGVLVLSVRPSVGVDVPGEEAATAADQAAPDNASLAAQAGAPI